MTSTLKYTIGRTRPSCAGDPDQFRPFSGANSFPPGHTAVAFAIATSIADETDDWVSRQMGPVRVAPGAVTVNLEF